LRARLCMQKRRPPLTTIFLWIVGVLTLVLTGYGIFTGVVLTLPFPYNILIVTNSAMIGIACTPSFCARITKLTFWHLFRLRMHACPF